MTTATEADTSSQPFRIQAYDPAYTYQGDFCENNAVANTGSFNNVNELTTDTGRALTYDDKLLMGSDDPTSDDAFVLGPRDGGFRRVDKGTQDAPSSETPRAVLAAPAPPPTSAPRPPSPGNVGSAPGPEQGGAPPGAGAGPGQGSSAGNGPGTPEAPAGAPGAPGSATATAGDGEAVVSWAAAPANGAAVDNYEITWSPTASSRGGEAGARSVRGSTLRATIEGLRNGATYTFSITATNSAGTGPAATTPAVTPDGNIPTAPTDVTASGGTDGSIDVSWTEADPNGASPVASYIVVATDGNGTQTDVLKIPSGSTSGIKVKLSAPAKSNDGAST